MCESEEIYRIHCETNAELRRILAELGDHIAGDEKAEGLVIRLREILSKRFLVNGIADWQREEE
jgi:hypothetical protein